MLAGWRALDAENKGFLSFVQFCQGCREILFEGDVRSLWQDLDPLQRGFISLTDGRP